MVNRLFLTAFAVLVQACALPHIAAVEPLPTGACFAIPESLDEYRVIETERFEAPDLGVSYGFTNDSRDHVTVFVYKVPIEREMMTPQDAVDVEGQQFEQTFPIGVDRGWYDDYNIAFSEREPVVFGEGSVPGYTVGGAVRNGRQLSVEVQYVYLLCGTFVKVRGTLPGDTWMESTVPRFARALVRDLALQATGVPLLKP